MQLGASQANQGTPPFWRGRLKKDGRLMKRFHAGCQIPHASFASALSYGGLAQLARAPALQAGGQRFESVILHYAPRSERSLTY